MVLSILPTSSINVLLFAACSTGNQPISSHSVSNVSASAS